jgi:hypothetical protein
MSPTARSLKKLRKEGWTASVVEKWIPQVKRRRDCFGFDVLACLPKRTTGWNNGRLTWYGEERPDVLGGVLGIQATSSANHSSRKAKLLKNAEAANWVAAGGRLEVWSWRKSSRAQRPQWICRTEALTLKDFIPEIT